MEQPPEVAETDQTIQPPKIDSYLDHLLDQMEQPPEVAETDQSSQTIQPLNIDMFDMFDIFDVDDKKRFAMKRLEMEAKEININPPTHISYGPVHDDDLFYWEGIIIGAVTSPYEEGVFKLSLRFPLDYPFKPPTVNFITEVYHPFIDMIDGRVDMDILNDKWSPALTVEKLMLSIASFLFLSHPDVDNAFSGNSIAQLYLHDMKTFNDNARKWTFKYATP